MSAALTAPFPWFGGKRRAAHIVWPRLGDVSNYVEPFAGSLAVLLARPHAPRVETVNDRDCYVSNFWRALHSDPEQVAHHADWPVNECDLHARHKWLVEQVEFREKMLADPAFYDAKIAGWWAWGISQWIGGGWCSRPEWIGRGSGGRTPRGINTIGAQRPSGHNMGVTRELGGRSQGNPDGAKRPVINAGGRGVTRDLKAAMTFDGMRPCVNGGGVHRTRIEEAPGACDARRPHLSDSGNGVHRKKPVFDRSDQRGCQSPGLIDWMFALADRLRRVRVICGDWKRVVTPSCTWKLGGGTLTGVLLDPPYSHSMRDRLLYSIDVDIAAAVRAWAIKEGENPRMRIALCGLAGEHEMPSTWEAETWNAPRGYSTKKDRPRETIWFSPHCIKQRTLFSEEH